MHINKENIFNSRNTKVMFFKLFINKSISTKTAFIIIYINEKKRQKIPSKNKNAKELIK